MPTFDPDTPESPGGAALHHLGLLLADCTSFQRLADVADAAAAAEHIVLGVGAAAWDGVRFTQEQLESVFCQGHLYPPDEDESAVSSAEKSLAAPLTGGEFRLTLRRLVRESEVPDQARRNNFFLWFFDECEALREELVTLSLARHCPRLRWVKRDGAPAYCSIESETGQGLYVWCEFVIAWGDAVGG